MSKFTWNIELMVLLGIVITAHLVIGGVFTKVEESFNVQAMHDLIFLKDLKQFDHHEFPGVVPRTFIGSIIISHGFVKPFLFVLNGLLGIDFSSDYLNSFDETNESIIKAGADSTHSLHPMWLLYHKKLFVLFLCRVALGLGLVLPSLLFLIKSSQKQHQQQRNSHLTKWFVICLVSQFHLMFYATRPLPNTFALAFCTFGNGFLLQSRIQGRDLTKEMIGVSLFVFSIIIFRCDVLIYLAPIGLNLFIQNVFLSQNGNNIKQNFISFVSRYIILGIVIGPLCLLLTVLIDSYFWQRWLWPEGEVLFFNTVLNKSHEWGTSPFHWYFTSGLLRSLLACYPLSILGIFNFPSMHLISENPKEFIKRIELDREVLQFYIPAVSFVIIYSILPHKEVRFLFPCLPMITLSAAHGLAKIESSIENIDVSKKKKKDGNDDDGSNTKDDQDAKTCSIKPYSLIFSILKVALFASFLTSFMFSYISSFNYPGGHAFAKFHDLEIKTNTLNGENVFVWIDTYSAMSGVSRFGEENRNVWKYSKDENLDIEEDMKDFEKFTHLITSQPDYHKDAFDIIHHEEAYAGINPKSIRNIVRLKPTVYIMKRKS